MTSIGKENRSSQCLSYQEQQGRKEEEEEEKRPEADSDQLLVIVSVRAVVGASVDNDMTSVLSG